jgi:GntR family transcriptional regulator
MFVTEGSRDQLLKDERKRFLDKEWPLVLGTITRLGLDAGDLLRAIDESDSGGSENE